MLIIYNICQIKNFSSEDSVQLCYWTQCIDSLLAHNYDAIFVISGCKVRTYSKKILFEKYGNRLHYIWYDDIYTISMTFNKAVDIMIDKYGEFEKGYLYVDSGINIANNNVFKEIEDRIIKDKYGMIMFDVDFDHT